MGGDLVAPDHTPVGATHWRQAPGQCCLPPPVDAHHPVLASEGLLKILQLDVGLAHSVASHTVQPPLAEHDLGLVAKPVATRNRAPPAPLHSLMSPTVLQRAIGDQVIPYKKCR